MFNLVYTSAETQPFSSVALLELLDRARENNARRGITGLLLYKRGNFMQVLEGEESAVRALYSLIRDDSQHDQVTTLLAAPVNARHFPEWSMGFKNLDAPLATPPGYNPAPSFPPFTLNLPWDSSVALRLLAGFLRDN